MDLMPNQEWTAALACLDDLERKVAELAARVTALEEEDEPPDSKERPARRPQGGRGWRG